MPDTGLSIGNKNMKREQLFSKRGEKSVNQYLLLVVKGTIYIYRKRERTHVWYVYIWICVYI